MITAVTITTCARPGGVSYLRETAEALLREGADHCTYKAVIVDGVLDDKPRGWTTVSHVLVCSVRAVMWRAFRYAKQRDVDMLLYCEDDITPCRNAVRHILQTRVPEDCAFVDFHDMVELRSGASRGLHVRRFDGLLRHKYIGNQCMMFPRRTIDWLVQRDPVYDYAPVHHADAALGKLLEASPWPQYGICVPALVRHIGEVSAAHPELSLRGSVARLPTNYYGDDFDPLATEERVYAPHQGTVSDHAT